MQITRWIILGLAIVGFGYDIFADWYWGPSGTISDQIRDWESAWWPLRWILVVGLLYLIFHLCFVRNAPKGLIGVP